MTLKESVNRLSNEMSRLDPGSLAELRRIDVTGPGTAAYWLLASRCGFLQSSSERWMWLVKVMAILTARGDPRDRFPLHDPKRRLGAVLCDGGNQEWPSADSSEHRPFVSEARLARLLAQKRENCLEPLERIFRGLASRRIPSAGINCMDIAAIAFNDERTQLKSLARDYYKRLDQAWRADKQKESTA